MIEFWLANKHKLASLQWERGIGIYKDGNYVILSFNNDYPYVARGPMFSLGDYGRTRIKLKVKEVL